MTLIERGTIIGRTLPIDWRWFLGLGWFTVGNAQACAPTPCTCVCQVPSSTQSASKPKTANHSDAIMLDSAANGAKTVWDGDTVGQGAKGWADCERKPKCSSSLVPNAGNGKDSPTALVWRGEGAGWIGAGWNWFGWWPKDAGLDVAAYRTLRMDVRVTSAAEAGSVDRRRFNVALKCSTSKECQSDTADLSEFAKGSLLDGKWHQVIIPLSRLTARAGFDSSKVWELDFNTWSESATSFSVYIDNIAFGN